MLVSVNEWSLMISQCKNKINLICDLYVDSENRLQKVIEQKEDTLNETSLFQKILDSKLSRDYDDTENMIYLKLKLENKLYLKENESIKQKNISLLTKLFEAKESVSIERGI